MVRYGEGRTLSVPIKPDSTVGGPDITDYDASRAEDGVGPEVGFTDRRSPDGILGCRFKCLPKVDVRDFERFATLAHANNAAFQQSDPNDPHPIDTLISLDLEYLTVTRLGAYKRPGSASKRTIFGQAAIIEG